MTHKINAHFPAQNSIRFSGTMQEAATMGAVLGAQAVSVVGTSQTLDINTPETLWDQGGLWTPMGAAKTIFIASSNNSDTSSVRVSILDSSSEPQTLLVTLTGNTPVNLGLAIFVFRVQVDSSPVPVGDVYVWHTGTASSGEPDDTDQIQSRLLPGQGVTHNGFHLIPANKTALGLHLSFFVGRKSDLNPTIILRDAVTLEILKRYDMPIFENSFSDTLSNVLLPSNSILELRAMSSVQNTLATVILNTVQYDNDRFDFSELAESSYLL